MDKTHDADRPGLALMAVRQEWARTVFKDLYRGVDVDGQLRPARLEAAEVPPEEWLTSPLYLVLGTLARGPHRGRLRVEPLQDRYPQPLRSDRRRQLLAMKVDPGPDEVLQDPTTRDAVYTVAAIQAAVPMFWKATGRKLTKGEDEQGHLRTEDRGAPWPTFDPDSESVEWSFRTELNEAASAAVAPSRPTAYQDGAAADPYPDPDAPDLLGGEDREPTEADHIRERGTRARAAYVEAELEAKLRAGERALDLFMIREKLNWAQIRGKVTPKQWKAIRLRYGYELSDDEKREVAGLPGTRGDLTAEEVATIMNIQRGTVYDYWKQARKRLRTVLGAG